MNQVVHIEQPIAAPPDAVFALLADTAGWPAWSAMKDASLERPAPGSEPEGVGAIRRFESGRVTSREEVVAFEPGRSLSYELLTGLPLEGYRADVTLTPSASGTLLTWHSTFRPKRPGTGWIYRKALQRFIGRLAADLGTAAEAGLHTARDAA